MSSPNGARCTPARGSFPPARTTSITAARRWIRPTTNPSGWRISMRRSGGTYRYVVGKVFGTTLADLFSRGISLSTDAVRAGGDFTIDIRVRNQGDGHTIGTRATVYLSADDTISGDDRALEEVTIPAIQPGHERVITLSTRLPRDVPEGTVLNRREPRLRPTAPRICRRQQRVNAESAAARDQVRVDGAPQSHPWSSCRW